MMLDEMCLKTLEEDKILLQDWNYFLIVSTTVVFGRLTATLTGMNCPDLASLPIFIDFPAIKITILFRISLSLLVFWCKP